MKTVIVLLRGVNVGGKNKVPMSKLQRCLEELGYSDVATYIASGNVLLRSKKTLHAIRSEIETVLPKKFDIDRKHIKALVMTDTALRSIISNKPKGFGEDPTTYHSDVVFLIDRTASEAMGAFSPKEGVDTVWPGTNVIYSQRLSSLRTKSRLNRVMGTSAYEHMTIRNWNTVTKLQTLLDAREHSAKIAPSKQKSRKD